MRNLITGRRSHELELDDGLTLSTYCNGTGPDGIITSGLLGVGVWLPDGAGDECIAAFGGGSGWYRAARHFIGYTARGRAYIRKGGCRWYLDEAIRTDYGKG